MRPHPAKRWLAAFAEGSAPWLRNVQVRLHLMHCVACRDRVDGHRRDAIAVRLLLGGATTGIDVNEALGRVLVRAGRAKPRPAPRLWPVWTAGVLAAGVLLVSTQAMNGEDRWNDDLRWLMNPDSTEGKEVKLDDRQFVRRLFELEKKGAVTVVTDRCCDDRDGEGPADDGLMFLTLTEEDAGLAVIYEDLDQSSSLTSGDLIRLVSRTRPPTVTLERHGPQFRPGSIP